jgi:flagellin
MSVINTNVNAVLAQNALVKNERSMSSAMEQLSTGKRINNAADDAAGLAIVSKMTSQIRGLEQATRNVNDAISMIQTAEGATTEITNMLQRMRELAVQGNSGTNNADEVAAIAAEFSALKVAINDIADTTQWNGVDIIDGTKSTNASAAPKFQIGANDSQTLTVNLGDLSLDGYVAGQQATSNIAFGNTGADVANTLSVTIDGKVFSSTAIGGAQNQAAMIAALNAHGEFGERFVASAGTSALVDIKITERAGYEKGGSAGITVTVQLSSGTSTITAGATSTIGVKGMGANLTSLGVTDSGVIGTLDSALRAVASQRADYGAVINRLEYTADNLTNVSQNTQASRSRIEDADYAKATTELARTQIIQQAGTAMLAQANQQSQGVLALLQ